MSKIVVKRTVRASSTKVWEVISDYQNIFKFHPFVESVDRIGSIERGVGAKRQCNLYNNTHQVEEVIQWDEGKSFLVKAENTSPFVYLTGGLAVVSIDSSRSELSVDLNYGLKWGLAGKLLDALVLRWALRYPLYKVLKSLDLYLETGEQIGKFGRPVNA